MKRMKNSGKMHIIMYVVKGRVEVTVGENVVRVRKGGQFSIPRGMCIVMIMERKDEWSEGDMGLGTLKIATCGTFWLT
jgi:hypothetical protein